MKIIETMLIRVISFMMFGLMTFLTIASFFRDSYIQIDYVEKIFYKSDNIILNLLFLIIFFFLLRFAHKKIKYDQISEKLLLIVLMIYVVVLSGLWSYATYSVPRADSLRILNSIQEMKQGNFSSLQVDGYLGKYQNQLGITAYFEILFYLLSGGCVDYKIIRVINSFMIAGIFYILYLITKELTTNKEVIIIELVLSFGWFPLILYSIFVYGSIPGLLLSCLGILFMLRYLDTRHIQYGIVMVLMFAGAIVVKNNYLIFAIAAAIILLVKAITERNWIGIVLVILMIVSSSGLSSCIKLYYESRSGIELTEGIPASAWIAMGMQEGPMAEGWYNEYNSEIYEGNGYDSKAADNIAKEYIKSRVNDFGIAPKEAIQFYYKKIVSQWNEATYECLWIATHLKDANYVEPGRIIKSLYVGNLHRIAEEIMNLYQLLIYFGMMLYSWRLCKEKDIKNTVLALCVLGGFLFHVLWEGKSQYIFPYVTLMIPGSAIGIVLFDGKR